MLFSSPDYPVFLIAVFFLYALSRRSGWARAAVMVLLVDVVVTLITKDVDALWDPIGGTLIRILSGDAWTLDVVPQWLLGSAILAGAIYCGRRWAGWIGGEAGRRVVGLVFVGAVASIGLVVLIGSLTDTLDDVTARFAYSGHLLVLAVLGIGLGAAQRDAHRLLGRLVVLFVVSALFYHAWAASLTRADGSTPATQYRYLLALLLGTIVLDYYLGLWIERATDPGIRKLLVAVSLVSNLGILFVFKYTDFFTQDVLHLHVRRLWLILPAGISFHTFQSLSYTIDVYRKEIPATRSVVKFATFVLFFPQLVAGPIVRAQDLLPQLDTLPALELERSTRALFRIACGLFKKIAIADTLGHWIVDAVFKNPERYSSVEVMVAVYGYALQIYCDFSAYSDIAIASADILGFTLPENFRTPYRSANLQEFWRRWHISLSTWLRDYLYITLGGNRGAPWRTYVNLAATMLLGGLWHGASWTFIVWGALHGFGLAITRFFQRTKDRRRVALIALGIAGAGFGVHWLWLRGTGGWVQLVAVWVYATPLWAILVSWLSAESPRETPIVVTREVATEVLRAAMLASGLAFFIALAWFPSWAWIALAITTWLFGMAADLIERRSFTVSGTVAFLGRVVSGVLTFHYVCLAWIFFRAQPDYDKGTTAFDNALEILGRLGSFETDYPNVGAVVRTALFVGMLCHLFADGSFRWLRDRFCDLPAWGQGCVLAACALALRALAPTQIVPFIYFQF